MMAVRRKYIRTLVEQLLDECGIKDKPVDVEALAVQLGARVIKEPTEDDLSGFLFRDHTLGEAVIGVNGLHHENRQRFTIGHELAHFLLHEGERVHVDRAGYGLRFRRERDDSNEMPDDDETEANVFAAELLMPARFLAVDMEKYVVEDVLGENMESVLRDLARKYKVSTQALTFRLANLGYIQL